MNDYEYAQAVMEAAGVVHDKQCNCCACAGCSGLAHCTAVSSYPDPLTSGDAFLALWDALEAKGWQVEFRTRPNKTLAQVYKVDEMGKTSGPSFSSVHEDRKVALVEAAGKALGVTR